MATFSFSARNFAKRERLKALDVWMSTRSAVVKLAAGEFHRTSADDAAIKATRQRLQEHRRGIKFINGCREMPRTAGSAETLGCL